MNKDISNTSSLVVASAAYSIVAYALNRNTDLQVTIHNIIGSRVGTLHEGRQEQGTHRLKWDHCDDEGRLVGKGVYFYRITTASSTAAGVIVL